MEFWVSSYKTHICKFSHTSYTYSIVNLPKDFFLFYLAQQGRRKDKKNVRILQKYSKQNCEDLGVYANYAYKTNSFRFAWKKLKSETKI